MMLNLLTAIFTQLLSNLQVNVKFRKNPSAFSTQLTGVMNVRRCLSEYKKQHLFMAYYKQSKYFNHNSRIKPNVELNDTVKASVKV